MGPDPTVTKATGLDGSRAVRRWRIEVTAGPSRGRSLRASEGTVRLGSAPDNDLVIEDGRVSRHHLEVDVRTDGLLVRDLGSKNGTHFELSRIESAKLPAAGGVLVLGDSELSFSSDDEPRALGPSPRERCGRLLGRSERMRVLFAQIERIAQTDATVLIHGETGTGKELVAEALHELGPRCAGPFVVVDCGAIPHDLVESELYGHVRGAFSGATSDRRGAFVQANGGTLLLDEIGELGLDLQPKLLRAIETTEVKPVGGTRTASVDVRIVAASHRLLSKEVAEKRFREDLFFRLSVIHLDVPPLRERPEDIPLLVEHFLSALGAPPLRAETMALLSRYEWRGNVRQLRNILERAAALSPGGSLAIEPEDLELPMATQAPSVLLSLPYREAKDAMVARFTREYLEALLARHGGNVSAAAREAEIDRNWVVALARRYGVRVRD